MSDRGRRLRRANGRVLRDHASDRVRRRRVSVHGLRRRANGRERRDRASGHVPRHTAVVVVAVVAVETLTDYKTPALVAQLETGPLKTAAAVALATMAES